jgi:outer membrane protein assembly factor BamB
MRLSLLSPRPFRSLFALLLALPALAFSAEFSDPLTAKLGAEWTTIIGAKSAASFTPSAEGLLLQAEPRQVGLIKREIADVGTDAAPLSASVQIKAQWGTEGPMSPGLFLYWDNANYIYIRLNGEGHLWTGSMANGNYREQVYYNIAREKTVDSKKWREMYVRLLLVSRNAAFMVGTDGVNWQKVGESGRRPGPAGKAPKVLIGRGWSGEIGRDAKPDLANDYYADGNKTLIKTVFSNFVLSDKVEQPGAPSTIAKGESWEQTLGALEGAGIPRAWSLLGPVPAKAWDRKAMSPDLTDDWGTPQKDSAGQPIKTGSWVRAEDDNDSYVDLAEHIGQASSTVGWAKSEIQWPVNGEALLWFSSGDPVSISVNNMPVYVDTEEPQERRAVKDRCCVPVGLNKGKNVLKIRVRQSKGDWGFFMRLERNDPGYRIRLLEKMLEYFPSNTYWRSAQARHEIVRRYEDMLNFPAALAACDQALSVFAQDDENRLRVFETKLRLLEFLRDYDAVVKSADAYLAAFPKALGSERAMIAALRGDVLAGRADAAAERVKRWVPGSESERIVLLYRVLAGAMQDSGNDDRRFAILDELGAQAAVSLDDRVSSIIESAVCRWEFERRKLVLGKEMDNARLAQACQSAAKALSLLPAGKSAMAAQFAQEAEADQKAGKLERAIAGYWGALLLAHTSSDPDAAPWLALNQAYSIALPEKDKDGKKIEDPASFKKALWKIITPKCGDAAWAGKWRFVGFPIEGNATLRSTFGPETDSNKADYGNNRKWADLDLDNEPELDVYRGNHDWGIDLNRWKGNAQVGFVARDFDVAAACTPTLYLGTCGAWFAWLDGKLIGENSNVSGYRLEAERLKLQLAPGKHRLLLKLEAPPEGPFAFRARISNEPEVALHLLVQALVARQFPRTLAERKTEIHWTVNFTYQRTPTDVPVAIGEAINDLYGDAPWQRLDPIAWMTDKMRETGEYQLAAEISRRLMRQVEFSGWYGEKNRHVCDIATRYFFALVGDGRAGLADEVLRDISNRYPEMTDAFFQAQTLRGSLRRDFGQSQGAQPFFEFVMRENPLSFKTQRNAVFGLEWARSYRPERLLLDTSHEVQATLDAIRRQLGAGGAEDIEKAMRNINEILSSAPGSLSKVVDSPFYAQYVGVREYIRALLGSLPEATRDVYRKVVETSSGLRLKTAMQLSDVAALEVLANEFYYTPAALVARNRAGNLYMDRGQFAQAASMYQMLLREIRAGDAVATAMALAKLGRAQLADGQSANVERTIERLRKDFGSAQVSCGGQQLTGAQVADRLKKDLDTHKTNSVRADDAQAFSATHMGGLNRIGTFTGPAPEPGPVVWAHPLIPNAMLERTRGAFELDVRAHLPAYPVIADGRVFVGGLESMRAIELASGKILWSRTWPSGAPLFRNAFNGYPISCPTVHSGAVYMRAIEGGLSSLRCYTADAGKLRWNTALVPELKKVIWLSDPAVAYGLAIAVYLEVGDMNTHGVAAIDIETGRLRWKTNLVTGNTGIKTNELYQLSTLHLGPPAVDGGEVYVNTGVSSLAAVNAFSGEVKWVTTYPRVQFGDKRAGNTYTGYDLRMCTVKTLARGPLSPIISDDLVFAVPKDGGGLLAIERQSGTVRWNRDLFDARFIAGIADGNLLLGDDTITAINLATGTVSWTYTLNGQSLYGQPLLSGGSLYLPGERELQRIDAKTGLRQATWPWDARIGPLSNFVASGPHLVGIGAGTVAALGPPGAKTAELPLFEARELEADGKLEAAAERYGALLSSNDSADVLQALIARMRILQRLNKKDEALATLEKIEQSGGALLSSHNGLWQVKKDVFARALRTRLGGQAAADTPPAGDLSGVLAFAWQLPVENPRLSYPPSGPQDCFYVQSGSDMYCMRISDKPEKLWQSYVGPGVTQMLTGTGVAAAVSDFRIALLDRATGEPLKELGPPNPTKKDKRRLEAKPFEDAAIGENTLAAVSDGTLFAWDVASGQNLWWKRLGGWHSVPIMGGLSVQGNHVLKVQSVRDERRNEAGLYVLDARTGADLDGNVLGNRAGAMTAAFSPDGQRLVYRADNNLFCIDVPQNKRLWQNSLPRLEARGGAFTYEGDTIRYQGSENGNGRWMVMWLNRDSGREIPVNWVFPDGHKEPRQRVQGIAFPVNGEHICFSGDWMRTISRVKAQGDKVEGIWTVDLPDPLWRDQMLLGAFSGRDRFHVVYVRYRGNQEQFLLRTFTWEGGQVIGEQVLPGSPLRLEDNTFQTWFVQRGNIFIYTAREGVFAFAASGDTSAKVAENLRQELSADNLASTRRADARRALTNVDAPGQMAFLSPQDIHIDGSLEEWKLTEPIVLDDRLQYTPLTEGANWGGKDDLNAKIYLGWNQEGIAVAVDVADDVLAPPQPGAELTSGDSIRVVIDSRTESGPTLDRNEDFVASLALVQGRSALEQELGSNEEGGSAVRGRVLRAPNGKGYRYEMLIPWPMIRKDPGQRPGWLRQLRLGVAIYDDDGAGVKGAMELGAGTTSSYIVPQWLTPVALLDISHEKIDRYRKVIDLVPGSEEAWRFLDLILLSRRGASADADRRAELERFITAHPDCENTVRALGKLRALYAQEPSADANKKLTDMMTAAKVPGGLQQMVTGSALKLWVMPDAKNPPQMIMLQLMRGDGAWAWRAYWGSPSVDWGRDGTPERMNLGAIPKPGQWTELTLYPSDFGMLGQDLKGLAFTTFGGTVYFDRLSVRFQGQEKVLMDDAAMDKAQWEGGRIKFVDNPKHDGAKSWTAERNNPNEMLLNPWFRLNDGKPIASFIDAAAKPPAAPDREKQQALYRTVAQLIQDTPEGLAFLQRVLELHVGETKTAKCLEELKTFLKTNSQTPNSAQILKMLHYFYQATGEKAPRAKCEELMQEYKLSRDVRRAYFAEFAPVWSEWQVLGPFSAIGGERRGLDTVMEPEKAVDLNWKTVDASGKDVGWKKISNLVDPITKKPNGDPIIDLRKHLGVPKMVEQKGPYFAYAYTKFSVPSKRRALMLFAAQDMVSIWLNGKRVVNELETYAQKDKEAFDVQLRSGENEILIKVGVPKDQQLKFVFRLAEPDGKPFTDINNE